jgi:hypothetical protein
MDQGSAALAVGGQRTGTGQGMSHKVGYRQYLGEGLAGIFSLRGCQCLWAGNLLELGRPDDRIAYPEPTHASLFAQKKSHK